MNAGWSRLDLGVGMVVAPGSEGLWPGIADLVDVVEVEPQTFWENRAGGGWQLHETSFRWLEQLSKPVICHGVSYPVGGSVRPDPAGVDLVAASAVRLGASHWSEHLSSTGRAAGRRTWMPASYGADIAQRTGAAYLEPSRSAS